MNHTRKPNWQRSNKRALSLGCHQWVRRDTARPSVVWIYSKKIHHTATLHYPFFSPKSPAPTPQIDAPLATNSTAALMEKATVVWARGGCWKFWISAVQVSPLQILPLFYEGTPRGNLLPRPFSSSLEIRSLTTLVSVAGARTIAVALRFPHVHSASIVASKPPA